MSPALRQVSGKELISALKKAGFEVIRSKGSHHRLKHSDGRVTTIPVHGNEPLGKGLLLKILNDCELTREELSELL
jgi:predicted RNA binding protein YcfA (HicA-like mRNA interferase family)